MKKHTEKYWDNFYKNHKAFKKPSSFARFVKPYIKGKVTEFGCGDCRDIIYFNKHGVGANGYDLSFNNIDIESVVAGEVHHKCPPYIYTRFFWHSIDRKLQLKILNWVTGTLFIEARTTEDKPKDLFGKHKRNLVNVPTLVKDLKENGFKIDYLAEGCFSPFMGENPKLIRVICHKG